jgi:hypothetical protein
MRTLFFLSFLTALPGFTPGQCAAPATPVTFGQPQGGIPPAYPVGWADGGGTVPWIVLAGPTPTPATGPSGDHTTGGGNYLYTEGAFLSPGETTFIITTGCFSAAGLLRPALNFHYHAYGHRMGTFEVEQDDGSGGWLPLFSTSGNQGDRWIRVSLRFVPIALEGRFRFIHRVPQPWHFLLTDADLAIDDVVVGEVAPRDWQINSPAISVDFDGVQGTIDSPALVTAGLVSCTASPVPATATLGVASYDVNTVYDLAISSAPITGASTGSGITEPSSGDLVNLDLSLPLVFLSTGSAATLPMRFPGAAIPGAFGPTSLTIPLILTQPLLVSVQGYGTDATSPSGYSLTQASQLQVQTTSAAPPSPGPRSVPDVAPTVVLPLVTPPYCYTTSGMPFFGTNYTEINIDEQGVITFGGESSNSSASVANALNDVGRVGFWTNLSTFYGGDVIITHPAPQQIEVAWVSVPYGNGNTGATFSILLDAGTGVIELRGLSGIQPNNNGTSFFNNQWLGISPGMAGPATDPGPRSFLPGTTGSGTGTDALYEFVAAANSPGGVGTLIPSLAAGLDTLTFTPNGNNNYSWSAQ